MDAKRSAPVIAPDPTTMLTLGESTADRELRIALARADAALAPEDHASLQRSLRSLRLAALRWRALCALYALALGAVVWALAYVAQVAALDLGLAGRLLLVLGGLSVIYGLVNLVLTLSQWER